MAGPWDTPPTEDEVRASAFDSPPTPEEMKAAGADAKPQPEGSRAEAVARGLAQGGTLGFADEFVGAARALGSGEGSDFSNEGPIIPATPGATFGERYRGARDEERAADAAAREADPWAYLAGGVLGGGATAPLAPAGFAGSLPVRLTKAAGAGTGYGAAAGAGFSEGETARDVALDSAAGGVVGAPLGVFGEAAGSVISWLRNKAAGGIAAARSKAANVAQEETAEKLASLRGSLGGETQKGSRQVENLLRLEQANLLTPAQQAELAALRASGAVDDVAQGVAQGTLDTLPGQAGTIAAKKAELATATAAAPAETSARSAELLQSSFGPDAKTLFKSYGEPIVWGALGGTAGDFLFDSPTAGATAGAVLGGRTRAGKAIAHRLSRPGNQRAIYEFVQKLVGGPSPVNPAGPAAAQRAVLTPALMEWLERYSLSPSKVAAEDAP